MKHSIVLKFLAFLLAAVSLLAVVGSAAGIVAIESADLYVKGLDELQGHAYSSIAREVAQVYAQYYAADSLGELPYPLLRDWYEDPTDRTDAEHWYVTLTLDGKLFASEGKQSARYAYIKEFTEEPQYIIASLTDPRETEPASETTVPPETGTAPETTPSTEPESTEKVDENFLYSSQETVLEGGRLVTYYLDYYRAPEYTVTVYLREEALDSSSLYLLNDIYPHRYAFVVLVAVGLLVAAVCVVFLVNAAGCCADGTVRPGSLNRLPLDLYTLLAAGGIWLLWRLLLYLWEWTDSQGPHLGNLSLMGVVILAMVVLGLSWLMALAAQLKAGDGFWWRHSVLGWALGLLTKAGRLLVRLFGALSRVMPLIWQWVLLEAVLMTGLLVSLALSATHPGFWVIFGICVAGCLTAPLYCGYCMAVLMRGARRMSGGELDAKIDTAHLLGNFRTFAQDLNALSETATVAARKQMRSERMRTELITNVSHDIKTPLTSIINFVDLLRKPHTEAQQQEYLEVLQRQSARMKKLIVDLMELSKASSGSIAVNLETVDAVEAVNQALGEFSDKLEAADLTPVFTQSADSMMVLADGRLFWRVMSNLLSNAVKYALPGTRLYVDLMQAENTVLLSLKNISRESLNMDPEELLERFVRGDTSRRTEGSGLGLNIAKTLMEVQGGKLRLMLDGDLFKVTLMFPVAENS